MEYTEVATTLFSAFQRHPIGGAIAAILLSLSGTIMPFAEIQLPLIVMQLFQITVWCLAGTASVLTILAIRKNWKK